MLKIKIHILDIQRQLSDDLSLTTPQRHVMEAYSIFSRVFFIPATLPFFLGLTLTRQVAYRKDLKEIKIQENIDDPASDVSFAHSPSGFSCPCCI